MENTKSDCTDIDYKQYEITEQNDQKLRQIYRNLPSYYLHWSPQSSRKQIRPPELTGPPCRPRDPSPVHYNQPDPNRTSNYRRVNYSQNRRNQCQNVVSQESENCHSTQPRSSRHPQRKLDGCRWRSNSASRFTVRASDTNGQTAANNELRMNVNDVYAGQNAKGLSIIKYPSQTDLVHVAESSCSLKDLKEFGTNGASSPNKHAELSQTVPWRKPDLSRECKMYATNKIPIDNTVEVERVGEKGIKNPFTMFRKKVQNVSPKSITAKSNIHQRYEQQAHIQQDYIREVPWRSPHHRRKLLSPEKSASLDQQCPPPPLLPDTFKPAPKQRNQEHTSFIKSTEKIVSPGIYASSVSNAMICKNESELISKTNMSATSQSVASQFTENSTSISSKSDSEKLCYIPTHLPPPLTENIVETSYQSKSLIQESKIYSSKEALKNDTSLEKGIVHAPSQVSENTNDNFTEPENVVIDVQNEETIINPDSQQTKTEMDHSILDVKSNNLSKNIVNGNININTNEDNCIIHTDDTNKKIEISPNYEDIKQKPNEVEYNIITEPLSNQINNSINFVKNEPVKASEENSEIENINRNEKSSWEAANIDNKSIEHFSEMETKSADVITLDNTIPPPPLPPATFKMHTKANNQSIINSINSTEKVTSPSILKAKSLDISEYNPFKEPTTTDSSFLTDDTADYVQESISSRIQRFEKQASFDSSKPTDKPLPVIKPVGPWVKKTSSGLVHQNRWHSKDDEINIENDKLDSFTPSFYPPSVSTENYVLNNQKWEQEVDVQPFYMPPPPIQTNLPVPPVTTMPPVSSKIDETGVNNGEIPDLAAFSSPTRNNDPLFDPWCDPENPRIIQFQDISAAAFKIKSGILNTPCSKSTMSTLVGSDIFFKKEFIQHTGSFKERGARYTLLCLNDEQKRKGVITASAGNHALALSYHGLKLDVPVTVVMPLIAPIMKVQACRQYGANVIVKGCDIGECKEIALTMSREKSLLYINGYDHPHILAGQGTMGLEIVEQVRDIDAVVIPIGGGGLIAGVALAVKSLFPHIKIIGAESENCASFSAALDAGHPIKIKSESTLADGLAVPCVGVNAFATASHLIDKIVKVKEEWIAIAILRLVEMEKAVVEGGGATGLAAILAGELPELKGKRIVVPLCGGNIDTTVLGRCLERGLAADGRLVKFTVTVSDRPGGIAELTKLMANLGVSIKDMMHERAWIKSDIFSVQVKVVCETRDYEHFQLLKAELEARYSMIRFPLPNQIAECRCIDD